MLLKKRIFGKNLQVLPEPGVSGKRKEKTATQYKITRLNKKK